MAAKTPTVTRASAGSLTLLKCAFTDIDDGDTYASGLGGNVWGHWFNATDDFGASSDSLSISESSGTFTFNAGQSNRVVDLFILATT